MEQRAYLFEALKKDPALPGASAPKAGQAFFFQLAETDDGFLLRVVDRKGVEVEADFQAYSGAERELLKAYDEVRWAWDDRRLWDEQADTGILLHEQSHLMRLLERSGLAVNETLEPLIFHPETLELRLALEISGDWVEGRMILRSADGATIRLQEFRLISESHMLVGTTVYTVHPVGMAFRSLTLFADRIAAAQLNEYLTLFFSAFSAVELECSAYTVCRCDPVSARPALIFQQVDEQSALHLDVAQTISGFSLEFAQDYDLSRVAFVDELEGLIRVREVLYGNVLEARAVLLKLLRKLSRGKTSAEAYLIDDDEGLVLGPDLATVFLQEHLAEIIRDFDLYGAEKLKAYRIRHVEPTLDVRLEHGIDFLEGEAELELEGERFSLFEALQQYRKKKYIALNDGSHAVLDGSYMERLERLFKKSKKGVRISFFDLPVIEELMEEAAREQLPDSREVFRGFNTIHKKRLQIPRFEGMLRPYQTSGVKWLDYLHANHLGGCLADDMGLGKTIQAIALLTRIYPKEKKPTLLVMPRSLLFNWKRELAVFAPWLACYIHHAQDRDFQEALRHSLILTTYGTLRSDIETIAAERFHAVVLDESQAIKNLKTQTAKAVLSLRAEFRLALSGTPIENNLGELYTLFRFLNPSMFGSGAEFERDYVGPIQRTGDKAAAHELRRKIKPFILRRLKTDVLKDLPPKVEQVLLVEMGEEQRKLYETRRRFYQELVRGEIESKGLAQSRFAVLEALLELRQIATVPEAKSDGAVVSAKREMLAETLQEAVQNNRKCLVFSNFLAGVEQVGELLNELEIPYVSMTGATANRAQLVERFQNDPQLKVFVMTLKTGGVGLNLTAADTVFILDPWWNTSAESQAVDRTHRIGQKKTVFTYRLIAENSIEEKILQLQRHKQELVDLVVSSDGAALKALTEEDIDHLLGA